VWREHVWESLFSFFLLFSGSPKKLSHKISLPLCVCVCNHPFIGKKIFGLKAKQTKINHWISRMNCYHSFDNSEAKQKKKNDP
jgi:hypothetical protein